jgi:beta-carotene 3-hydroxylase
MSPLEKVLIWAAVGLPLSVAMEPWAAFLHGKVWHRWGYVLHESHHVPRTGTFEANDLFALTHAIPAIAMILYGCVGAPGLAREIAFGLGLGLSAFGLAYALVHDGLIHERLPLQFLLRSAFIRRVVAAHKVHHQRGEAPYGLFWGPIELREAARRSRAQRAEG